ncbi:alpha-glucosidase domain-containing protein [Niastella vici]|uniref:alpha-glucosidase domain-containing protein n=1 Tax=Niastella vici TaxID=1703345 RepID=UPI001C1F747B|nr:alpha-glucosidase domain-containing protein [Niastella vici]
MFVMIKWSTFLLLLTALCISNSSNAQSCQKTDLGIKAIVNSTAIEIQYYTPSTVRVLKSPEGRPFTKESLSVIKKPQKTPFNVKQQGDLVNVRTAALNVVLNLKTGDIFYSTANGELLLKEKREGAQFTPFNDAGNNTLTVQQSFVLDNDEPIYGLGQQQQGKMSQRNVTLHMVQGNLDDYVPFFQSVKGYGVFLGQLFPHGVY